jgi:hypothetical protein
LSGLSFANVVKVTIGSKKIITSYYTGLFFPDIQDIPDNPESPEYPENPPHFTALL